MECEANLQNFVNIHSFAIVQHYAWAAAHCQSKYVPFPIAANAGRPAAAATLAATEFEAFLAAATAADDDVEDTVGLEMDEESPATTDGITVRQLERNWELKWWIVALIDFF